MTEPQTLIPTLYAGWRSYQTLLIKALTPLPDDQLTLRAAPGLRSIGEIAAHMIRARANWFHQRLGEGGEEFAALGRLGSNGTSAPATAELIRGLEATWKGMQEAIARWTPAAWQRTYPGEEPSDPETITPQWVIWHLIEHDLHHGGEISLTLGMHGLAAPDL